MIIIKSDKEIEKMRRAGKLVADCHELVREKIKPGITTGYLDEIAREYIKRQGAIPTFLGYSGFPASICASVNDVIVHGIPGDQVLKEGDIISVDLGATLDGYVGDAARTHAVGEISPQDRKLIEVTERSFFEGIKNARPGKRLGDISHRVQQVVEENGFSVVRDYVGHGIGRKMHEDPQIPNFGPAGHGPKLVRGMCLAIEPMVNAGTYDLDVLDDNWTAVTLDGEKSAHYENTIVVTDGEPEILTL